jgi:hypothetical protein
MTICLGFVSSPPSTGVHQPEQQPELEQQLSFAEARVGPRLPQYREGDEEVYRKWVAGDGTARNLRSLS